MLKQQFDMPNTGFEDLLTYPRVEEFDEISWGLIDDDEIFHEIGVELDEFDKSLEVDDYVEETSFR